MEKNNLVGYVLAISVILVLSLTTLVSAQMQETNYNYNSTGSSQPSLVVQVLKYEPFPVNAGEWFDLWVKVQNVGQNNANDVRFELQPDYPFYSNDSLVRDYGLIYGAASAYRTDQTYDSSQVILKYRVKAVDNAPEGANNIKLMVFADKNSGNGVAYSLPIEIGKTKTDFEVIMQDSSSQGTSFNVVNTGNNAATAVSVSIEPQENVITTGASASIIGNLAKGDYTSVTFPISPNPNLNQLEISVSYTDTAGVRNTVQKIVRVSIDPGFGNQSTSSTTSSYTKYTYLVLGIIAGFIIVWIYRKIRRKK